MAGLTWVRNPKLLAYLVCVVPALLVAAAQPIWSRVDEAQHWDFVAHLAGGSYPVEARTYITQPTLDLMAETGIYRWNVPGTQPVPVTRSEAEFTPVPSYLHGYARKLWLARHLWWFSYEAAQPPLAYLAAVPFWLAGDHLAGLAGAVYAVRFFDALLIAGLGPLALALAGRLFPGERRAGPLAVGLTALTPGLLMNGTQVTNDALAALLGGAALVAALAGRGRGWPWRWALLAGALFGLALAAKLTTAGLAVLLAAAVLWPAAAVAPAHRLRAGAVVAGAAALVVAPWVALNEHLYGHPLPTAASFELLGSIFQHGRGPGFWTASLRNAFATYWAGEPYNEVPLHRLTTYLAAAWCIAAAAGLWRLRRRRPDLLPPAPVAIVLLAIAAQAAWAAAALELSGIGGWLPGRYLYPVASAVAAILAGGLLALVRRPALAAGAFGFFAVAAALNVGGFLLGFHAYPAAHRTGPSADAVIHAVAGTGEYAGFRVSADRLAADPRQGCIWIHIEANNQSGGPVDWWPVLYVMLPGESAVEGVYGGSTAFPDSIAPGGSASGWAKVLIPPSALRWPEPVTVRLVDIAADRYRHLGDLAITLQPA